MIRTRTLMLFLSPLGGWLIACVGTDHSEPRSSTAGGSGIAQGGAAGAPGGGGMSMSAEGGRAAATSGAAGTGGQAGNGETANSGHAGQGSGRAGDGTSGQVANAGTSGVGLGGGGAAAGGAATGGAAPGTAGSAPVAGPPGASDFTSFTVRTFGSYLTGTDTCAYLDPSDSRTPDPSTYTFDKATQTVSWDYCDLDDDSVVRGSSTPPAPVIQSLLNTLSLVTLSTRGGCRGDATGIELEFDDGEASIVYLDDTGWCGSGTNDMNYATALSVPLACSTWIAGGTELPQTPHTLTVSTGEVPHDPNVDPDCAPAPPFPRQYELDLTTGILSWQRYSYDAATEALTACPSGTVTLTTTELDSVLTAYGALVPGASGPCDDLPAPASLDDEYGRVAWITVDGSESAFSDEAASCHGGGNAYAIGVAALAELVVGFSH